MDPTLLIVAYCALVVAASLLGGWLPTAVQLTHTRLQLTISFVAGLMLGVSLFLMLPHAAAYTHSVDQAAVWLVVGLLGMFFLIRTFHFHEHEPTREHAHRHSHQLSWVGVAVGLALHTAIDGIALGASVVAEASGEDAFALAGLGAFLAVMLHKPLDAMAITSLMSASGRSKRMQQLVNFGFALMCPLGALLFYLGVGGEGGTVVGCALAFSAGVFLCISLADLLPELQFHRHDRLKLSAALLIGVLLAYGIGRLEAATHGDDAPGHEQHEH